MTVGDKIKKARQIHGWTQNELAQVMSLPVSRIQQYEANIRNPKPSQLEEFAKALGVSIEYLKDHSLISYNDVKHALLELEDTFKMTITNDNGKCFLQFDDRELTDFFKQWNAKKEGSNQSSQTLKEYEKWKITYPEEYLDESAEKLHKIRDEHLKEKKRDSK